MPSFGDLFADLRGEDRTLRVSYHPDRGAVVLSLWSGTICRGSFRMPTDDVDRLLALLTDVRRAATPTPPDADDAAPEPAAVEGPAEEPAPSVERTGDISAHRVALLPTPRVA
ncbi:hypothetical protein Q2K19_26800 [Micromonospora soli]|uniref:hypothetical protein n=1 Tax=Micromonospora sp. NBRC 110009 TaxID=3061627 RepID=UPI002670F0E7|nr:hypothetical protein [Micromonospora sp. NBRC 110009]WKT97751.1 hypothetical protein Q2K19_26800 [Micromonospora sp. NBRC 110009]